MGSPRFVYLHGFASSPESRKARAFAEHFAGQGFALDRLDLRVPSMERLSLAAMLDRARAAIGGPDDRALLVGSSLGGLCALRAAQTDARVAAVVVLAPALRIAARWRATLGEAAWAEWRASGWRSVKDHATGGESRVHHAFVEELAALDERLGPVPDVRVPTLIVHGTRDDVVDVAVSRELAAGRRHARLVELDDDHELAASIPRILAEVDAFAAPFGLGARPAAGAASTA